jgi:hypothetical protein
MMKSHSAITTELRISLKWVVVALMMSGLTLALVSDMWSEPSQRLQVRLLALLLYVISVAMWFLDGWTPRAGRWFAIISVIALISVVFGWSGRPEILVLLMLPIALAAALINRWAALVTAIGETTVLVLLLFITADLSLNSVAVSLIGIWGMLGIMSVMYFSIHRVTTSLDSHHTGPVLA